MDIEQYRWISARSLLNLPKLDRCQALPPETWTPASNLWCLVFISHRWGGEHDPDPTGSQLAVLKQFARRIEDIAEVLTDEPESPEQRRVRLARVPSLNRQGTLQAAHLIFRSLAYLAESVPEQMGRLETDSILDVIGFWYDYSCLPQDPRTPAEAEEFARALQDIGEMVASPRVSTLVLRKEGDGYLGRGWCFAESMIASAKEDVFKPMVLRTDRWDEPFAFELSGAFSRLKPQIETVLRLWEEERSLLVMQVFERAINETAGLMLARADDSMSEFVVAATAATSAGVGMFADVQARLFRLREGDCLDLAMELVGVLRRRGLGCRDERDEVLVALLLLKSSVAEDAKGDLIWWEALKRFTQEKSLVLIRRGKCLKWK